MQRGGRPGLSPALLFAGYLIVILAPLILAAAYQPHGKFLYRELAAGFALVGFALLFMQFVLSGRFEIIAGRLGIDILMRFHQLLAPHGGGIFSAACSALPLPARER